MKRSLYWKNRISSSFGLKMMVKSGLEKIFLKILLELHKSAQNPKFSNKKNHLPAWRDFKINFSRPLFTDKLYFLDTDSILRVKTMYEQLIFFRVTSLSTPMVNETAIKRF